MDGTQGWLKGPVALWAFPCRILSRYWSFLRVYPLLRSILCASDLLWCLLVIGHLSPDPSLFRGNRNLCNAEQGSGPQHEKATLWLSGLSGYAQALQCLHGVPDLIGAVTAVKFPHEKLLMILFLAIRSVRGEVVFWYCGLGSWKE